MINVTATNREVNESLRQQKTLKEMDIPSAIKNKQGTILDVRTSAEFMGGHAEGAVNIPLQELPSRMDEIKAMPSPLILCCASGNRSGQAEYYLRGQGVSEAFNAGSWLDVNYYQSKN